MNITKIISKYDVDKRHYEPKKCVIDNINNTLRECLCGTRFESIDNLIIKMYKDENGDRIVSVDVKKFTVK